MFFLTCLLCRAPIDGRRAGGVTAEVDKCCRVLSDSLQVRVKLHRGTKGVPRKGVLSIGQYEGLNIIMRN